MFLLFFLGWPFLLKAQMDQPVSLPVFQFLSFDPAHLPENIVSSRTAVIVSIPLIGENNQRGNWEKLAEKAHDYFYRIGLDAVAYYYLDDVFAGSDVTKNVAANLNKRKIENLAFLVRQSGEYQLIITPFNGEENLVDFGQKAWKANGPELDPLLTALYRAIGRLGKENKNLLIIDQPEYFTDFGLVRSNRFEVYQSDLKLDKLAVPKFNKYEIPDGLAPQGPDFQLIARANQKVEQYNLELEQIMQEYPYEYEIVDLKEKSPEQLRNEGFQYLLMHIQSSAHSIKKFLNYPTEQSETDYVTINFNQGGQILKTIPVGSLVNKYYVKHIYTGDIFLGSLWEADLTWQSALKNHIRGMKEELNIR